MLIIRRAFFFVVGAGVGRFRAFDARTGKEVWTVKPGGLLEAPLTDDSVAALAVRRSR